MKSTRDGFGEQLLESGIDESIIVLSADLGKATKTALFGERFTDRYIEVGIAENNMIGIASGLSEHGYKVFASSFASFLSGKYDTIRCSVAYSNAPIILVGSHCGLAIGRDGVTQMGLEDVSIMRALPNMVILNPSTYTEAKAITKYLCETKITNPHYLRIGRQPIKEVFKDDYVFKFGVGTVVYSGSSPKTVVISTGCILPDVLEASAGLPVLVVNMPTIKPIDSTMIYNIIENNMNIITVEDHSIIGGLGSAVAEIIAESGQRCKFKRIGINDVFPESGSPEDLYNKYNLSVQAIRKEIVSFIW